MRFYVLFVIFILSACTHDPASVRVYHYGTQESETGGNGVHTVQDNDTFWSIAQRYNVPLRDLIDLNQARPPYYLSTGERLLLPAPSTYRVRKGDSLYAVSRLFNSSVTDISRLNHLESPYIIHEGQILQVPSSVGRVDLEETQYAGKTHVPEERLAQSKPTESKKKKPVYTQRKPAEQIYAQKPEPRTSSRFMRPVSGKIISRFGAKKDSLHNDGINIKAPRGTSVRAAENGIIAYADSKLEGYGNLILLKHTDGYITAYAHMDKLIGQKGQKIKRGETIGTVGSTGNVKTPQLHFELRKGTKTLNPAQYLD